MIMQQGQQGGESIIENEGIGKKYASEQIQTEISIPPYQRISIQPIPSPIVTRNRPIILSSPEQIYRNEHLFTPINASSPISILPYVPPLKHGVNPYTGHNSPNFPNNYQNFQKISFSYNRNPQQRSEQLNKPHIQIAPTKRSCTETEEALIQNLEQQKFLNNRNSYKGNDGLMKAYIELEETIIDRKYHQPHNTGNTIHEKIHNNSASINLVNPQNTIQNTEDIKLSQHREAEEQSYNSLSALQASSPLKQFSNNFSEERFETQQIYIQSQKNSSQIHQFPDNSLANQSSIHENSQNLQASPFSKKSLHLSNTSQKQQEELPLEKSLNSSLAIQEAQKNEMYFYQSDSKDRSNLGQSSGSNFQFDLEQNGHRRISSFGKKDYECEVRQIRESPAERMYSQSLVQVQMQNQIKQSGQISNRQPQNLEQSIRSIKTIKTIKSDSVAVQANQQNKSKDHDISLENSNKLKEYEQKNIQSASVLSNRQSMVKSSKSKQQSMHQSLDQNQPKNPFSHSFGFSSSKIRIKKSELKGLQWTDNP